MGTDTVVMRVLVTLMSKKRADGRFGGQRAQTARVLLLDWYAMNHTLRRKGDTAELRLSGELDALTCPDLRPVLDAVVAEAPRSVTVNLSEVVLIDSSGIGAMVSLYKRIRALGGEVRFVGVNAQPLVVFRLLRLDRAFHLD